MWKKWGPVISFGIITAILLFGMGFFLNEIKGATDSRITDIYDRLDIIQSSLAAIGESTDNIDSGIGRIIDGLSAYEIGYYASLEGFGSTIDAILGNYERGLNGRIEAIKSGK